MPFTRSFDVTVSYNIKTRTPVDTCVVYIIIIIIIIVTMTERSSSRWRGFKLEIMFNTIMIIITTNFLVKYV